MSRILTIILFAFIFYCQNIYAQSLVLRGKVVQTDYSPVKDAMVYIDNYPPVRSKITGEFVITLDKDPSTIQKIRIEKKDFEYKSHKYRPNETFPLEIIVDVPHTTITGRIIYRNGKGVINCSVILKNTTVKDSIFTDKLGYFKTVVLEKIEISTLLNRGVTVNGKDMQRDNMRAMGLSFLQVRLVEDPPTSLFTLSFIEKNKVRVNGTKVKINEIEHLIDNQGFIKTTTPDFKNSTIEVEGFKILDKQFSDNNFVEISLEKILPPPTSTKTEQNPLNAKEKEKAKQDTIRNAYANEISTISSDIEKSRKLFEEQNQKVAVGIVRLSDKIKSDTSLNAEQVAQMQKEIGALERTFMANDDAYQRSKEQTEDLLNKLKEAILQKDSLGKQVQSISQQKANVEEEKRKLEQAKKEAEANFRTKLLFASSAIVILSVLVIIVYVFLNRINTQKKEIEKTRNQLLEKVEEIEEKNVQLKQTLDDLKRAQAQMVSSEKMASLGQLTAGIAHEINNPVNFTYAGALSLKTDFNDLLQLLETYRQITPENIAATLPAAKNMEAKLAYPEIKHEIDDLLLSVKRGAERTAEIVKSLRTFARLDEDTLKKSDVEENLDATLVMLHSQYKERIEIVKTYTKIPPIECFPGQLNQVFMNILLNSIQAIEGNGKIFISTSYPSIHANGKFKDKETIEISIRDTGIGMSEDVKQNIFEPFFTTKDVGVGSGLGLSVSFGIIEKHKGEIKVFSEVGKGSEFVLILPINSTEPNIPKTIVPTTAVASKIQQV